MLIWKKSFTFNAYFWIWNMHNASIIHKQLRNVINRLIYASRQEIRM